MNVFQVMRPVRERKWLGYTIGVVAVAMSLAVRLALGDIALKFPFVIFLPPIVLTTFVGGVGPGIAAAILGGICADLTLIAAPGHVIPSWPAGWLALLFYTLTVALDIVLIHVTAVALDRTARADASLRRSNEELEIRVAERTAALVEQVAEREAAQAQLRQMQKMESIGQMTGGIAHDFNNMLAVVIGSLGMARRRIDSPTEVSDFIASAEEGARRASQLVARLLAFARQQPLEPRALDLDDLVAGMSDLLRQTIGGTVQVETVLAAGRWRCCADGPQLENAILNIAINARDAMPGGGRLRIETANVTFAATDSRLGPDVVPGEYVMIAMTDTGTGMPPHVIERIFEPFFTTKEAGRGTGLGLSQVYGFVKQSGGHVAIESREGAGTTIRLYLPRDVAAAADLHAAQAAAPEAPIAKAGETVLVVDDEAGVRLMSADALRELGYTVAHASDGAAALDALKLQPSIDLLFTDVIMPGMNGRQLVDAARALRPDLRVVFTTGYAGDAMLREGVDDVRTAVLPKPFTLTQLAAKVRDMLDRDLVGA